QQRGEGEADEGGGDQLGDRGLGAGQVDHDQQRGHGDRQAGREEQAQPQRRERQQLIRRDRDERQRDQRQPQHLGPGRHRGQVRGENVPSHQRGGRQAGPDQYGGRFSYHSPSIRNAAQNACLASASFSDSSMSGTGSTSMVGVQCWISPGRSAAGAASGKARPSRKPTAGVPMATIMPGCTMWISRVSQPAKRSRSCSSGSSGSFRQRVPYSFSGSIRSRSMLRRMAWPARPKNATPS